MKKIILSLGLMLCVVMTYAQLNFPRTSTRASVSQEVGISTVTVKYSRPNVVSPQGQDRTGNIWGKVVHYGFIDQGFGTSKAAPWRAGADENTTIEFSHDAIVEGSAIAAGKYGLHMAVEENGDVTVIFNKRNTDWGSYFYDEKEDALRVSVKSIDNPQTSLLTYSFPEASSNSTVLALDWEKKRIPVEISCETPEIVYQDLKNKKQSDAGFNYPSGVQAANFLVRHNIHLEDALAWASNAVEGQFYSVENFQTLQTRASVLAAMGKTAEADAEMRKALDHQSAAIADYYNYGRMLIAQKRAAEALEIFKSANKKWADHWLAPHGLARGYSANGDYKSALKFEKQALAKAPEGSKGFLEGYLKTLEEGKDFN